MQNLLFILAGVLTNAFAQILLKLGMNTIGRFELSSQGLKVALPAIVMSPYVWGGLASYVFSVLVWLIVLSRVDVSFAYPFVSLGYVIGLGAGYWLFGEAVTGMRVLGVMVIIAGVFLVSRT